MSFGNTTRRFSRTDKSSGGETADNVADAAVNATGVSLDLRPYFIQFQFSAALGTVKIEALGPRDKWTVIVPALSVAGSPVWSPTYPSASYRWTYTGTGGINKTDYSLELR